MKFTSLASVLRQGRLNRIRARKDASVPNLKQPREREAAEQPDHRDAAVAVIGQNTGGVYGASAVMRRRMPKGQFMYSYSFDEENYHGEYATIEDALAAAKKSSGGEYVEAWIGENEKPDPLFFIDAEDVIEQIACQEEFSTDWGEGWPGETKEQRAELTEKLRGVFREWLDKHNLHPTFWNIKNPQRHSLATERTAAA